MKLKDFLFEESEDDFEIDYDNPDNTVPKNLDAFDADDAPFKGVENGHDALLKRLSPKAKNRMRTLDYIDLDGVDRELDEVDDEIMGLGLVDDDGEITELGMDVKNVLGGGNKPQPKTETPPTVGVSKVEDKQVDSDVPPNEKDVNLTLDDLSGLQLNILKTLFNTSDVLDMSEMNDATMMVVQDMEESGVVKIDDFDVTLTGKGLKLAMQHDLYGSRDTDLSKHKKREGGSGYAGQRHDNASARERRVEKGLSDWK